MALRWRKNAQVTGLARVCAGARGHGLYDGDKQYASVTANHIGRENGYSGWYWSVPKQDNIPYKNTCNEPCETEIEAKKAAMEYVKKHIN